MKPEIVLLAAIALMGNNNANFTDTELAGKLETIPEDIQEVIRTKYPSLFRTTKLDDVSCDICNSKVPLSKSKMAFCSKCLKFVDLDGKALWSYGLETEMVRKYLKEQLYTKLKMHCKLIGEDSDFSLWKTGGLKIAFSFQLSMVFLKDYYAIKGWELEHAKPQSFVIISPFFHFLTKSINKKDMQCTIVNIEEIFYNNFFEGVIKRITINSNGNKQQKSISKALGLIEIENDIIDVEAKFDEYIKKLPEYATKGTSEDGRKLQRGVIALLNLTIFKAMPLGGKNIEDGAIILNYLNNKKETVIPIEIKSFKRTEEYKFLKLMDHTLQIRKYADSYQDSIVKNSFNVPVFLIIAYDFDISDLSNKGIQDQFKADYNAALLMVPLKSLLRLLKTIFTERIVYFPNEEIEKFLGSSKYYIGPEEINRLIINLKKFSQKGDPHNNIFKRLRELNSNKGS